VIGVILALIIAWLTTRRWKRQRVTVHKQDYVRAYIRAGSMVVTHTGDNFLHRTVSKTERVTESSSGGGGGGSFSSSSGGGGTGHSGKGRPWPFTGNGAWYFRACYLTSKIKML